MKLTNVQSSLEFDCQDTLEVMDIYVIFSGELTSNERNDAAEHMLACKSCRDKYLGMKLTDTALRVNRDWLVEQGVFNKQTSKSQHQLSDKEISELRFEAMMGRALSRRKRRERKQRIARVKRLVKPFSAVAACLIAAIGVYLTVSQLTGGKNAFTPTVAFEPSEAPVKIELLTDSGSEIISASQPIIASSGLKTLRINDNRQMVLNAGTQLSVVSHDLGCIVKLDKGEIYTEVEHDDKPFIVETIHGRAVITGTTFNIKTDDKQMELAVAEGTVRFEGDKGKVNVTSGYKSQLTLNTIPTQPQLCDTGKLTAWATGINDLHEIVATTEYQSDFDLPLTFDSAEIDMESIDYKNWIEQKRSWFKQEFPHIFKFKEALAKEGIEVDYPELLIKSGDLWHFAFPGSSRTQLTPPNYESMLKLASAYDKDAEWLSNNLHINQLKLPEDETSTLKALNRWTKALEESLGLQSEISSKLLMHSLHASVYFYETRTLAWLAVNSNQIALTTIDKQEAATLLEQEIKAASDSVMQVKQLFTSSSSSSICDEDKQRQLLQDVIENIELITRTERKLWGAKLLANDLF